MLIQIGNPALIAAVTDLVAFLACSKPGFTMAVSAFADMEARMTDGCTIVVAIAVSSAMTGPGHW